VALCAQVCSSRGELVKQENPTDVGLTFNQLLPSPCVPLLSYSHLVTTGRHDKDAVNSPV